MKKKIFCWAKHKCKRWRVDFEKIEKKFEKHINTSVPFYDVGHDIILELSSFFNE